MVSLRNNTIESVVGTLAAVLYDTRDSQSLMKVTMDLTIAVTLSALDILFGVGY